MTDQTSKVVKAVSDARTIGFNDGLGQQVDELRQRYDGLETDINLHEQKLDAKTEQYVAKLADLDQVGRYLQRYTTTVNQQLVPVLRAVVGQIEQGITHHTDEVTKDVYQEMKKVTGKSMSDVIKTTTYQELQKARTDTQQASLSAKLSAKVSQEEVSKMNVLFQDFKNFVMTTFVELLVLMTIVLATPGKIKWISLAVGLICCGLFYWRWHKEKEE